MKLFLDSSVLLAAAGSRRGASHAIFTFASHNGWELLASPYINTEVERNLYHLPATATAEWAQLRSRLSLVNDVLVVNLPVIFGASKDRPIVTTALAYADVLLTLDEADFAGLLSGTIYGMAVLRPGEFLQRERSTGCLKVPLP